MQSSCLLSLRPKGKCESSWVSPVITGSFPGVCFHGCSPHRIDEEVLWNPECDRVLQQLKLLLCSSPVLRSPDFSKAFILQMNVSDHGIRAVLSQRDQDGDNHPVAYYSRKLLPREQWYSTIEKGCLAIKLATHAFCVYLLG